MISANFTHCAETADNPVGKGAAAAVEREAAAASQRGIASPEVEDGQNNSSESPDH